ncbi:MAG TPA: VWA domain-containing protein [Terriglobia bacterium]|nr:VWA domain-containing protein [Terriglobia bacterium]
MTHQAIGKPNEKGIVLFYFAGVLVVMLLFAGLAIDLGRGYVIKAQLTKAVDGAALAAARALNNSSTPEKDEAIRIFRANFPSGYLGTSSVTDPASDPNFFNKTYDATSGANIISIQASAVLPTTFMKIGGFQQLTVASQGEARRKLVDLSLVLDCSSSIGSQWTQVHDAAVSFVNSFDETNDRISLVLFSNGATVPAAAQMPSSRGFVKANVTGAIPGGLPGGSTAMVEGIYRGWDELRSVPVGSQSGLRVIVLFTDGCSNSVPGLYEAAPGLTKGYRTYDFPKNLPDPDGQTWDRPYLAGLFDPGCLTCGASPNYSLQVSRWDSALPADIITQVPLLPLNSNHVNHRSSGIPTSFPLQTATLTVNGIAQNAPKPGRGLRNQDLGTGRYPADVWNTNNAARNLLEIIANAARSEYPGTGDYPIRIYTIGMGLLIHYNLGTIPELPEDILKRIANDKTSADYNAAQLAGKYYFAQTAADVGPAFQALRNELIRLSK